MSSCKCNCLFAIVSQVKIEQLVQKQIQSLQFIALIISGGCDGTGQGRDTVLSNYALIIMIFFFLQKEEILPSIKELQVRKLTALFLTYI